jgi:integrase/recombinase XerD
MKQYSDPKKLPKSVTLEEFVKLMKNTKDKQARTAFLLAFGSGLRIQEVKKLKKSDIEKNLIQVTEGKGGKDRIVPIPKGWRGIHMQEIPIKKSMRSLQRNFKESAKKSGLNKEYTFHSLRHGFAVRCVEKGVPLNQLQALMGHTNLQTTSVYTKARPMDSLKSYEELF